ncbi:MAG: aspartyl/glutamyl-tRNA amidotransferase subunit C [Thaumarchaeota archaeon]|nr:aspartyl/glutamyl-tRNA amidotransferase subunit C [Nitrososphaerota archaeon]
MVSKEEIEHVAKLMKIDLDDHAVHIDRVQKMIEYFDILDKAATESEEIIVNEQPLENLREDKYEPYKDKLIDKLKHYKEKFVRAPKMV